MLYNFDGEFRARKFGELECIQQYGVTPFRWLQWQSVSHRETHWPQRHFRQNWPQRRCWQARAASSGTPKLHSELHPGDSRAASRTALPDCIPGTHGLHPELHSRTASRTASWLLPECTGGEEVNPLMKDPSSLRVREPTAFSAADQGWLVSTLSRAKHSLNKLTCSRSSCYLWWLERNTHEYDLLGTLPVVELPAEDVVRDSQTARDGGIGVWLVIKMCAYMYMYTYKSIYLYIYI
jgi:hypothetical protein